MHLVEKLINNNGKIDISKIRPIARLGYMDYAVIENIFSMQRPKSNRSISSMQEGFVNQNYYKIVGEGTPLVLISGLGADHTTWIPLLKYLQNHFKIILFNNRGIGKSSIPNDGECTIKKMAEDLNQILQSLHISKTHLLGHSLGGYIAQEFSATYPEKIDKLILLSSKTSPQPVQRLYIETTLEMMKNNVPREIIIKNTLCWLFSNKFLKNPALIEHFIVMALQKPLEESRKSYLYQVNAALNFDTSQAAKKITSPTLVIAGEQDILVPIHDAMTLHHSIKNSDLKIINDMAHMAHIEMPEKIANLILEFMK